MENEKRLIDANALQFEPGENCVANGVLIWGGRTGGKTMTTVLHALKVMVGNAPTVDAVEVKHGRWLNSHTVAFTEECSQCGFCVDWTENGMLHNYNYCPNCGADMRERNN